MSRARHRKKSLASKKFKQAATVTTTGAVLAMSASPAMADEPVVEVFKQQNYANVLPALEKLPPVPAAVPATTTVTGDMVVAEARKYLGANYVWGGESLEEGGFDCSGLIFRAYSDLGVSTPRTSGEFARAGVAVPSLDQAQAGDILHWPGHVAIYIGNGQMIESSTYGKPVAERSVYGSPTIRRILTGGETAAVVTPEPPAPEAPAPVEDETPPTVESTLTETITVQAGDYLSKIAPMVGTTWQELYEDNREVIGDNPNLIYPGQVFFVGGLLLPQEPVIVPDADPVQEEEVSQSDTFNPVPGARFTSGYGPRDRGNGNEFHKGIDLAAPVGTPIHATTAGQVITNGWNNGGCGFMVQVRDIEGFIHTYCHMAGSEVLEGQWVEANQVISHVDSQGNSTGPHLHYVVESSPGMHINAETWLNDRGVYVR